MKLSKKLLPALAMLLISAVMMSTASFAWFVMATDVTATDMKVKAQAEQGIVISNASNGTYAVSASSANANVIALLPASTSDCATWYHSIASAADSSAGNGVYTSVTNNANSDGKYYHSDHTFYIRTSSADGMTTTLSVKSVSVTGSTQSLSDALRVGVKIGDELFIYAPSDNVVTPYYVWNGTNLTTIQVTPKAGATVSTTTNTITLPANNAAGYAVNVFIWFEGEDADCKSSNIVGPLEELNVSVVFSTSAT